MADLEQCSAIRDGVRVFYVVVQLGGFVPQLSVSGKARGIRAFCVLQRPMPGSWRKYQKEFFYRFAGRQFRGNVRITGFDLDSLPLFHERVLQR